MIFGFRRKNNQRPLTEVLMQVDIFEGLSKKEVKSLLYLIHIRQYSKDEIIFEEGQPGYGIFIIIKGKVELSKENRYVESFSNFDFFGDLFGSEDFLRTVSAISKEDSTLAYLSRFDLIKFSKQHKSSGIKILMNIIKIQSQRVEHADKLYISCIKDETKLQP